MQLRTSVFGILLAISLLGCAGATSQSKPAVPTRMKPFKYQLSFIYFKFLEPFEKENIAIALNDQRDIESLADTVVFLKQTDIVVDVVGTSDPDECRSTDCAELSVRRARYVVDWLLSNGVPADRLGAARGVGAVDPVAPSLGEDARFNRRIEFRVRNTSG